MASNLFSKPSQHCSAALIALSVAGLFMPASGWAQSVNLSERQVQLEAQEAQLKHQYTHAARACYSHFFVNQCLAKVDAHYRQEKAVLRAEQLVFEEETRAQRVRDRNERERQKRPARMKQPARTSSEGKSLHVARRPHHERSSSSAHPLSQVQAREQLAREAERRAENVRRFEAKQRAAERHRLLLERRREARKHNKAAPPARQTDSKTVPKVVSPS